MNFPALRDYDYELSGAVPETSPGASPQQVHLSRERLVEFGVDKGSGPVRCQIWPEPLAPGPSSCLLCTPAGTTAAKGQWQGCNRECDTVVVPEELRFKAAKQDEIITSPIDFWARVSDRWTS